MKNIRTYALIVDLLQRKREVTLRDIASYLEKHDVSISYRTLERYIQELRDDYDIISDCNRKTNTYSFNRGLSHSTMKTLNGIKSAGIR